MISGFRSPPDQCAGGEARIRTIRVISGFQDPLPSGQGIDDEAQTRANRITHTALSSLSRAHYRRPDMTGERAIWRPPCFTWVLYKTQTRLECTGDETRGKIGGEQVACPINSRSSLAAFTMFSLLHQRASWGVMWLQSDPLTPFNSPQLNKTWEQSSFSSPHRRQRVVAAHFLLNISDRSSEFPARMRNSCTASQRSRTSM
ncbi:hypothetical protein PoB_004792200 [Plakobranchus ocellatus]|uniref:Uncharacterized protein n=1 Tax=Plakobranchus ocellatus TaxID=259542 RepID=A0AAV4BPX4_9GAST|nr:hypothetical protein PoB_004792200 [Plakobranchus ocellatus]